MLFRRISLLGINWLQRTVGAPGAQQMYTGLGPWAKMWPLQITHGRGGHCQQETRLFSVHYMVCMASYSSTSLPGTCWVLFPPCRAHFCILLLKAVCLRIALAIAFSVFQLFSLSLIAHFLLCSLCPAVAVSIDRLSGLIPAERGVKVWITRWQPSPWDKGKKYLYKGLWQIPQSGHAGLAFFTAWVCIFCK